MEKQKIVKKKVKRIGITLKEQPLHSGLREINTETCPHLQQRARPCWRGTAMVHWMAEKLQWCLKVLRKAVYKEVPHWGHARGGDQRSCWLLIVAGCWALQELQLLQEHMLGEAVPTWCTPKWAGNTVSLVTSPDKA